MRAFTLIPRPKTWQHAQNDRASLTNQAISSERILGDQTKGWAFLNSCELYINLAPHQFVDDTTKIIWAFLYMKSDWAAYFMDRQMWSYWTVSGLSYADWQDFITKFTAEFCLKNKVQMARMELETLQYFQGTRAVDEYINAFSEMIDHAQYFEGAHIILKFWQGLNTIILYLTLLHKFM
jgi:hypothetical protein